MEQIAPVLNFQVRPLSQDTRVGADPESRAIYIRPSRGGQRLEIAKQGLDALLKCTGLTHTLIRRVSPETFGRAASEALRGEKLALMVQEEKVTDIVPASQRRRQIDIERVFNTVDRIIPDADYQRALMLPNHSVQVEVVGAEEHPVVRGDLVRAGVLFRVSPLGLENPLVQSYCTRLACTNGAVSTDVVEQFGYGEGDDLWHWFRHSMGRAYRAIEKIIARFRQLAQEEIPPEDRANILSALLKRARLDQDSVRAVQAEALANPPTSSYEMFNLLTWATTHVVQDAPSIVRGMNTAAEYSSEETHRRICPVCHRAR